MMPISFWFVHVGDALAMAALRAEAERLRGEVERLRADNASLKELSTDASAATEQASAVLRASTKLQVGVSASTMSYADMPQMSQSHWSHDHNKYGLMG